MLICQFLDLKMHRGKKKLTNISMIITQIPDNVFNPLRDEDEEEEEEEVGGRVADELQEGLSHCLQYITIMISKMTKIMIDHIDTKDTCENEIHGQRMYEIE